MSSQPRTRGKSSMAANTANTNQQGEEPLKLEEAWEATLTTILTRLNKLEKLDRLDQLTEIEAKIDTLTTIGERLTKLTETTDAFVKQTRSDIEMLTGVVKERDRQQEINMRERLILQHRLTVTERESDRLRSVVNDIINKSKEQNLKIEGKGEEEGEDLRDFVMKMAGQITNNRLDPTAIVSINRIGKKPTTHPNQRATPRPRPILVIFRSIHDRNVLYYTRTKLHNNQNYKNIYINDDITMMTRKAREDFRSVAALVRTANKEVRIHDDGIIIEGKKYRYGEADKLPAQFSISKAKTVRIEGGLYFQSANSFLSNFFPAPIVVDGKLYPTAEHKLQADKCIMAGDNERLEQVRKATTPLDAKIIGDQVRVTKEWNDAREETLRKVIDLKFKQNPEIAKKLIQTRQFSLHEATTNSYYGIGAALNSKELRNKQFNGENKLGKVLEEKRAELNRETQVIDGNHADTE